MTYYESVIIHIPPKWSPYKILYIYFQFLTYAYKCMIVCLHTHVYVHVQRIIFFSELGFELRSLSLSGKYSTTWADHPWPITQNFKQVEGFKFLKDFFCPLLLVVCIHTAKYFLFL
jgi:hypothetical protein